MSPGASDDATEGLIDSILAAPGPAAPGPGQRSELLTFLFADVRGYTRFTQIHGDEAAGKLTAKFAATVRELVADYDGTVLELRGDEALCIFRSPRQSLRLAVALQQRFVEETAADTDLPMTVGIGVDAGEAVRGDDGYRGGALNLAARLCAQAKAGEVLATSEVTHLARTIDGVRYVTLDPVTLKGLAQPVRPVRVTPVGEDPAQQIAALTASGGGTPSRWLPGPLARHRRLTVAAAVAAAAVAAASIAVVLPGGSASARELDENSLGIFDAHSGRLVAQTAVDAGPAAATVGFGAVWLADTAADSVSRIDIGTHQVTRITGVGAAPSAITAGLRSVWVTAGASGTVTRIDPATNQTVSIAVGSAPSGVTTGEGAVWVTNSGDGTVSRIDPTQNRVVETIDVGDSPVGIVAGRGIWVANSGADTVSLIGGKGDRHSVVATVRVGNDPRGIVIADGAVWVTNNLDGTVSRLSGDGSSVLDTVPVGAWPDQITAGDGRIWVATEAARTLTSIDPRTARVVRTVRLGVVPGGLTVVGHQLWVGGALDPSRHVGGTLHVLGQDPESIDPTYFGSIAGLWLFNGVYDHLVGFRQATGADGTALVPDVAAAIPEPADGGRTYRFRIRRGIRWSDGRPLTVDDVRRGLERAVASGSVLSHEIAGATGCTVKQCRLPGVAVDAATSTVTVTLSGPSSRFLSDLATLAPVVPAATPLGQQPAPLASTGPYRVATYTKGKLVVLGRNPYFREWSAAAQPAGYPDRIEWQIDASGDNAAAVDAVDSGNSDFADARGVMPVPALQARFGSQLHLTPTETTHGVALNTRIPPFNDVRVRRALAFAIDRQAVSDAWFTTATVTCQVLPPNFPGHHAYCPYTLRSDATGIWHGPDLQTALRLVQQSGTTGMAVTVLSTVNSSAGIHQVVAALKALGYDARLDVYKDPTGDYFGYAGDSRHHVQAAFWGWVADNLNPGDFFDPQFRCSGYLQDSPSNQNPSGFCDQAVERLISRAVAEQSSSAIKAEAVWAEVDRRVVDAAPWIGLVTPTWVDVVAKRVHGFGRNPMLGILLDQLWIR